MMIKMRVVMVITNLDRVPILIVMKWKNQKRRKRNQDYGQFAIVFQKKKKMKMIKMLKKSEVDQKLMQYFTNNKPLSSGLYSSSSSLHR